MDDGFSFPAHIRPDLLVRLNMELRTGDPEAQVKRSGYRIPVVLDGDDVGSTGWFLFRGGVPARPGEVREAEIALLNPQFFAGRVGAGTKFTVSEGAVLIARGQVLEMLDLEDNARRQKETEEKG